MEIRVLRYFVAVAEAKTISGAAKRLHLSQPTLSRQISELESETGSQLFTRGAREITLTDKGRYLLQRANAIIALVDKTQQNLQTDQTVISGSLDIGAGESRGMQRLMDIVAQLQQDYPAVSIHLHSGDASAIEAQLADGRLDFGVIMGQRQLKQYGALKLPEVDQWGVIMPESASLAQQKSVAPADLVGIPLMLSEQALHRDLFQDWWRNVADQITIVGTYNLIFNATLMVANGSSYVLGFANLVNTGEDSPLTFRPLEPALTEPITVVWSKEQPLSPIAQLFLKRLEANLELS
ncbi:transcriptional regulator [Secundilactobacillus paracollinoides]|uniref:LysR family transcriptional regulator n=1 Tax=Secundilactobacillus paracollinoides TaxID=240427 RepID=UPI0006D13305|nr:LysR family transcriptional regulator [Secundilactobacillus paracollinoides]ANZ64965.1 transcriptional regulator [Secundilactobacillus paracollinoides]KRL78871.1 transcriptional regulator [Secundilactobacillus paracollinoides DSM 15502 = JCM 11969]